jgi:hypothetical protein
MGKFCYPERKFSIAPTPMPEFDFQTYLDFVRFKGIEICRDYKLIWYNTGIGKIGRAIGPLRSQPHRQYPPLHRQYPPLNSLN